MNEKIDEQVEYRLDVYTDELFSVNELARYVPSQSERTNFPYSGELYWKTEEY